MGSIPVEVSVFLSSAPEDVAHREVLLRHLESLRRAHGLRIWHDGLLRGGETRAATVRAEIDRAAVVLLLVSADYLSSDEHRAEMDRALSWARSRPRGGIKPTQVVPILLRPCSSGFERIAGLSSLPSDGRPVTTWPDADSAWTHVVTGLAGLLGGTLPVHPEDAPFLRASDERLRLLKKLEDAHARRRRLAAVNGATNDVDAEILKLKRELRDGGQVREGDILQGRYTLLRRIGRGGFATVWEAEDREEHSRVAVKILHADLAGDTIRRERFFRGARIMTELGHDAIVRVLATEQQDGGFHYLVMEYLAGGDLQTAVLEGRVPLDGVVPIIARIGNALTAAHEHPQRFIHRDVKPANILLDELGHAKLGDFDLVGGKETTGGTRTGAMGSFVYAAPEMLSRPQDADARVDVFGLGMTALFCFYGKKLPDIAFRKPERVLAELRLPRIEAVLAKAVEWEASERFADVRAFCAALCDAEGAEQAVRRAVSDPTEPSSHVRESNMTELMPLTGRHAVPEEVERVARMMAVASLFEDDAPILQHSNGAKPQDIAVPSVGFASSPDMVSSVESARSPIVSSSDPAPARPAAGVLSSLSERTPPVPATPMHSLSVKKPILRTLIERAPFAGGVTAALLGVAGTVYALARVAGYDGAGTSNSTPSASPSGEPVSSFPKLLCPLDMVPIVPPAEVWVGSKVGVGEEDEHPRHKSPLKRYCIDKTEVTVAAYVSCIERQVCARPPPSPSDYCNLGREGRGRNPINCVTLEESRMYCKSIDRRLPSEEEWEFAARGPDEREFPWGSDPHQNQLCWGREPKQSTCVVGSFSASDSIFGVSDMAGNVWEWTDSIYCPFDSTKECRGARFVIRGGGWYDRDVSRMRGAFRYFSAPLYRGSDLGFRCAKD